MPIPTTPKCKGTPNSNPPYINCPTTTEDISQEDFDKLMPSVDMGPGQACGVAGTNIKDSDGNTGWVDIKGIRHNWSGTLATQPSNRSESCQTAAQLLNSVAFSSIPEDPSNPPLTNTFNCNRLNVDPIILSNLSELNSRLLTLGTKIQTETNKFTSADEELKRRLGALSNNITNQIKSLEQDQHEFSSLNNGMERPKSTQDILGIKTSSEFILSTNYLKYIVALILVLLLLLYTSYAFSSDNMSIISIIIVGIVALFLLYKLVKYINYKFF